MRSFCVLLQENYNYQFIINKCIKTNIKYICNIHCSINVIFLCALTKKRITAIINS